MERRRKAKIKKKMIAVMLTVCLSILFSGMTCMAAAKEDVETYEYRELSPIITQLSTTAAGLPPNVSIHQQVQLQYEFY